MKRTLRNLLGVFATVLLAPAATSAVYTYTFTGGDPAGDQAVPSNGGLNIAFGQFSRTGVTSQTANDVFRSSGWNTGTTRNENEYVQFIVTPGGGAGLTLYSLTFDVARNTTGANHGPYNGWVEIFQGTTGTLTSKGTSSFALPNGTASLTGAEFNFADFSTTANEGITVRFYGWNASRDNDWMQFDNVAVEMRFDTTPVPEPTHYAMAAFGLIFAGVQARRMYLRRRHA